MHDIWNPWHGCVKKSEGCQNCYMYFLDRQRNADGQKIYRVKNNFDYPLHKDKNGAYKVRSGEQIRVCMTSDFFLEEADAWRSEAWKIIKQRPDVVFFLLTKRPERAAFCLPPDWGDGWENVFSTSPAKIRFGPTSGFLSCLNCRLSTKALWSRRLSGKSALKIICLRGK